MPRVSPDVQSTQAEKKAEKQGWIGWIREGIGNVSRRTALGAAILFGSTDAAHAAPLRPAPPPIEKKNAPETLSPPKKVEKVEEVTEAEEKKLPPLTDTQIKGYLEDLKNPTYKTREVALQALNKHFDTHVAFHFRNAPPSTSLEEARRREVTLQKQMPKLVQKLFPYSEGVRKEWFWLENQEEKNAFKYVSPSGKEMSYHEVDSTYRTEAQAQGAKVGGTYDWQDYNWALRRIWNEQAEVLLDKALEWTDKDQKIIEGAHAFNPKDTLETLRRRRVESKVERIPKELERVTQKCIEDSRAWRKKNPSKGPSGGTPPPIPIEDMNMGPREKILPRGLKARDAVPYEQTLLDIEDTRTISIANLQETFAMA
jgi:hypothetical protein